MKIFKMKTKRILASALVVLFLSQTVASDIYATAFGMGKVYAAEEDVAETQAPAEAEETPLVIVETGANESEKEQVVADEIGSSETAQVEESIGEETTVAETEATVEEETLETEETVESEETVETEETEETEESVKSVYTYSGNGVTVTATLSSPDVIPDDAIFRVTPITSGTAYNAYMAAMDKADPEVKHDADNTVLFDVAFLVQDESGKLVEFEPEQGTVRIQITFTQKQLEKIDAKNEETKIVHLPLKDSVKDRVDTTLDAGSITVNDILPEVLTETKANGETLNFTMDSFSTVGATLATAYKQTSFTENLNELVKDVTIQASKDENGNLIVNPDNSYKIALRFEEKPNELEFDNTKVIYTFPDGINPAYAKDTFEVDLGGGKVLKGNTYEIKDGKIYVTWNQKDSNYATFIASSQAWFELTADAKVSKFSELISFGTDVDKQYTFVQDKGNASIEKSGWFDESNGIIYYTITVKSQGKVKNVKVTDTVKGNLVQYDKNTVTVNGAPAGAKISHNSKGFTYTIPELSGNQTVTITYSAKVDMSKIGKDGKLVLNRDNTLNTVSLEGDDLPKQTDEYYVSKEMNYTSLDKSGSSSVNGNQAIITWTITANEKMQANMAGQTITDRLPYEGNNKMSSTRFYGNGVKVEAYSGNNRVYTKTLTWAELGIDPNKQATQTWSYKIPNNDQKYKYVFTYQTVSDLTNLVGSDKWSIKNEVTDTFGNKDTEKIEFTPGKDQKTKLKKTGYKQSDNKGNWTITFTVPASGLSSCILDDILPNAWVADALRSDKLDRNSLKVTGLTTGESYDFEEIYVEGEGPGFRLTFKKDGQSGLKDTGKSRTITVAYTTTPDSNWLDKATEDWQARHLNKAKLYANNIETKKEADIYYPKAKSFDKQGHLDAIDGNGKPVYAYDLLLTGVDQDTVVIEDTFDTSLFTTQGVEHYNVWGGKIFGADWNVPNLDSANQYFTSMVPTATGVKITANVPKRADGTYYSNYKLVYFVTTKDDAALKKLQENAAANNGKTVVRNKATWEGLTDQLDLEYEFNPLKKNGEVVVENGKNTDQVKFTLTINTAGVDLDPNSDTVELLDKCTNLTILPETVKTTPNVAVTFDRTSDGYKFVIPDATALTLEYTCEINHLDGSQATWSNTASLKGYKVDTSGSYEVYTSGAKGGAKNPGITVVKHAKGDLGHTLNGATFRLLDADRNPVYNNRDQEVTITTTKDGSALLIGDSYNLGWTLLYGKQYYLEETVAPDGYVAEGTLIPFVISETDRNGTTLFKDGDSLYVANEERQYSPVQVGLNASKTLIGRDILSDEFSFTLSAKNDAARKVLPTAQTVSNKGNTVGFENIEFNEPGTYTFDIAEVIPASADKVKGVTYDEAHHTATVVVTAGQNGSLEAKVTYDNGQSAVPTFTNTYKAQPTSAQFDVVKTLSGRSMAQGEFEFELLENGTVIDTVKAPAATMTGDVATSSFKFNAIEYSKAGKHTYTIREKLPNGAEATKDGVTYDANEVTVVVDVQDDGNGNLTKTVTYTKAGQSADHASFVNSYTVKEGEAYLHVRKELTGRDLQDGDFTFEVRDETGKIIRTARTTKATMQNGVAGVAVNFDKLTYNEAGTYKYTISEVKDGKTGITYSEKIVDVTVEVRDNGKGQYVAKVTYDGTDAIPTFENSYKPLETSADITARKTLTGRTLRDAEFDFILTAVSDNAKAVLPQPKTVHNSGTRVAFGNFTFKEAGDYIFEIAESAKNETNGITYDTTKHTVLVSVKDNTQTGQLEAKVSYDGNVAPAVFENSYQAGSTTATVSGTKSLTGRDLTTGAYSFTLTGDSANTASTFAQDETYTVPNGADGSFTFPTLTFTEAGVYTYTVKEVIPSDAKANVKDGVTYDATVYTVKVDVSDDGNGQLTAATSIQKDGTDSTDIIFSNSYTTTPTKAQLGIEKMLHGRAMVAGEFAFDLVDKSGNVVETIKVPAASLRDGVSKAALQFSELSYEEAGTYTYTIREQVPTGEKYGVTYDEQAVAVTVNVIDNEKGALVVDSLTYEKAGTTLAEGETPVFHNYYNYGDTSAELKAFKTITGRDLKDGEFTFELKGTSENAAGTKSEKVNAADGTVNFGAITYTQPGDYEYVIRENSVDGKGVTVDTKEYKAVVHVTDLDESGKATGKLTATVVYSGLDRDESVPTFKNTYKAAPVKAVVSAAKELQGRALRDQEFTFELTGRDSESSKLLPGGKLTAQNSADGTVTFQEVTFEEVGQYHFALTEKVDDKKRSVSFDETRHFVTIEVTDNGEGQLVAVVTYVNAATGESEKEPKFINTTVMRDLAVRKSFLGKDNIAETGTVSFQLYRMENGQEVAVPGQSITLNCATLGPDGKYHWTSEELIGRFTGLQAYDEDDNLIQYLVKETSTGNFTIRYQDQNSSTTNEEAAHYNTKTFVVGAEAEVVVENCEFASYTGTKTWNDFANKYGVRPTELQVTLYQRIEGEDAAKAKPYVDSKGETVSQVIRGDQRAETWEYQFTGLPVYADNGEKFIYSVKEDYVLNDDNQIKSTSSNLKYYTGDGNHTAVGYLSDSMNLTNTLTTVNVSGKKVWDDAGNTSKRPESIVVRLVANGATLKYADGSDVMQVVSADAEGNWNFTFENVPNYYVSRDGGVVAAVEYAVTEDAVPGYATSITGDAQKGYTITNTLTDTPMAKVYLVKVDSLDQNKALAGATFGLYHEDGTVVGYYTSNGSGVVMAEGLKQGTYYFKETAAPGGYKLGGGEIRFTITKEQDQQGVTVYVGKVTNEKTPTIPDTPNGDKPETPEVLGARRDELVPDQGQVLGARRAPKTGDSSKAVLWMLVMGGSGIGAAAVMAQRRKQQKEQSN